MPGQRHTALWGLGRSPETLTSSSAVPLLWGPETASDPLKYLCVASRGLQRPRMGAATWHDAVPPLQDRPSPRGKTWVPSHPPHLTVPPARLHIPPLRVQPPAPRPAALGRGEDAGQREGSPSRLSGPRFLPAPPLPGPRAAPPREPPRHPRPNVSHQSSLLRLPRPTLTEAPGSGDPSPCGRPHPSLPKSTRQAAKAPGHPPRPCRLARGQGRRRSRVRFGHEGPGPGDTWGRSPAHTPPHSLAPQGRLDLPEEAGDRPC